MSFFDNLGAKPTRAPSLTADPIATAAAGGTVEGVRALQPIPGLATGEHTLLRVDAAALGMSPVAFFAQVEPTDGVVFPFDLAFRLYGTLGGVRMLIDQGRMRWDALPVALIGPAEISQIHTRLSKCVAVANVPCDSYELTVSHEYPWSAAPVFPLAATDYLHGEIRATARQWGAPLDVAGREDVARIAGNLPVGADPQGQWTTIAERGPVLVHRVRLTRRLSTIVDGGTMRLWPRVPYLQEQPLAAINVGTSPAVDVAFPQPLRSTDGLRLTFGPEAAPGPTYWGTVNPWGDADDAGEIWIS